jgi:hypothetical protein
MSQQTTPTYGALPMPLQDGEIVLQLIHRHWWFLWPRTILWVIFAVAPVVVLALIFDAIGILDNLGIFFWIVAALWLGWWAIRLILNWYRYANDIWIVTNQRIIDSFKPHPFSHRLATADLVNVQDISVEKIGLIATVFRFGDVVCQTAAAGPGGSGSFRIIGVPNPAETQLLIDKERDRERTRLGHGGISTTTV